MAPTVSSYEVFLSYNSADHGVAEDVARKLRDEGLEPFLDRWYLAPGARWRSKLEDALSSCKAVAIFVGPSEMDSWQQREVDVVLDLVERIVEKQSEIDRVLIVVDQFEELYTLTLDEEVRRRLLDELLAASSRAGSKANIALTLRGDFVGRALAYRPLSDRLQDAQINLGPMTREELDCAIRASVRRQTPRGTGASQGPGLRGRVPGKSGFAAQWAAFSNLTSEHLTRSRRFRSDRTIQNQHYPTELLMSFEALKYPLCSRASPMIEPVRTSV